MKQLVIEEEGLVDLTTFGIACEGFFNIGKPKDEVDPNVFNTTAAFEKVRQYSKNPEGFTINTGQIKTRLCFSLNGVSPSSATELLVALEKTLKQVYTVATKLEKDRLAQALILGATINTFNINMGSNLKDDGKVSKTVIGPVMNRVMYDARRSYDSYFQQVGRAVQKEAEGWLGGSPFNLKLKPETGRYRNAGGGKLKSVGPAPIADKLSIDKLVKTFLQNANVKTGTFNHSTLDDRALKHYVEYSIDPELKSIGKMTKPQKQALAIVFSGKSNSQTLQYELCEAMKCLYTSLLVYLDAVIIKKKD